MPTPAMPTPAMPTPAMPTPLLPTADAQRREPRRAGLTRVVRRHRRPLAALLTAAAVVVGLTSLRPPAPAPVPAEADDPSLLAEGEVAVPIQLASPAMAATVRAGDIVDLVGTASSGPRTLGTGRVLQPSATGGFAANGSAYVLVALPAARALDVAVSPEGGYAIVIRSRLP